MSRITWYRQKGTLQNLENTGYTRPAMRGCTTCLLWRRCTPSFRRERAVPPSWWGRTGHIRRIFNHKYPLEYIERFDVVQARKQGVDDFYAKYADLDPETAR